MPPEQLSEKFLIEGLKRGEASSFSTLFTSYYSDLVMFAVRITGNTDTAEEVVQESFMTLWECHDSLDIASSLKSYMLRTIQNRCIDWLRHQKIMHRYEAMVRENSPDYVYDTDNYLLKSELESRINEALLRLPPPVSQVFLLSRNEGLKYHEIAERLGVSVRTVENRMARALDMLRQNLKEYLPGSGK